MSNNNITEKFSILIADDHSMFIDGIKTILERNIKLIQSIYTANNGLQAMQVLEREQVDLVITDINMPCMNGIELTKEIEQKYSGIKVLVLTMDDSKSTVAEILDAEADGYVLKNSDKNELIYAISRIMNNGTFYSNDIFPHLIELNKEYKKKSQKNTEAEEIPLSDRETEIVKLICEEKTSREIADILHIAKVTIDVHRKNILQKIKVTNSIGIYKYAVRKKILEETRY